MIDELATLTAFAERSVVRRIEQALGLLLTKGRAVGITVLAAVQDPGKDVVGWRDLFPTRVAMRLDTPIQVDMVPGEGAATSAPPPTTSVNARPAWLSSASRAPAPSAACAPPTSPTTTSPPSPVGSRPRRP